MKAAQDLRRVEILLSVDPPDPEGALFHSQQAAEKALKAFLTFHDVPFRRVHELDELGEQCAGVDTSLADLMSRADALTKYAWRFRYPGAPYEPALDECRTAFSLAREVVDAMLGRLPIEARPWPAGTPTGFGISFPFFGATIGPRAECNRGGRTTSRACSRLGWLAN